MDPYLIAVLIFCLRIIDVSIGTVRVIYTIRGNRLISLVLGIVESGVWIFAISRAFRHVDHPASMIGWACGFGAGVALGITLEKWIASGWILMRAISTDHAPDLRNALRAEGYGVTAVPGEGRDGSVLILFVVARRRRARQMLKLVQQIDRDAFITIEPISQALGGYLPGVAEASAIRK